MSLRARLVAIVLLALAPVLVLQVFTARERSHHRAAEADAEAGSLAVLAAGRYGQSVEGARQLLATLAEAAEVRARDARASGALFARVMDRYPRYLNVGMTDAAGRIVASGLPADLPLDAADRDWFRCAVAARDFCIGGFQVGRITLRRTINFGLPLVEGGAVRGVLFSALDLAQLETIAAGDPLADGSVHLLLDADGAILVRHPRESEWEGRPAPAALRRAAAEGGPVEAEGLDGVRRRFAVAPVLAGGRPTGLRVAHGISSEATLAPIRRALTRDLAILAALGAAVLLACWAAAERFVLAPARALEAAARRLAGGDIAARTGLPHGDDEIGLLARTFDEAAEALERQEAARAAAERRLRETKAQLHHAQKMEAVGLLAGGVAHDFNNLLTVITSSTDLVLAELPPAHPARADAEEVRQAADRAADLARQLLAFSRQQVLAPRLIDLNGVVRGVDRMIRRLIGEQIEVRLDLAADLRPVVADPGQIEQVVMNLAVNARDAMPAGGTLTIETSNADLDEEYAADHLDVVPGPHACLAVHDTGAGMDAATCERIFEPFFTTKGQGKGTGLGLSTVYGIVKQSGGHIWVYSEPGRGTTFRIYFPAADEAARAAAARPAVAVAAARPAAGRGKTTLLVEDDAAVRRAARRILAAAGHHVLEAADGAEAERLAAGTPIDLLIVDLGLPGASGTKVADRIAALRPGVRVLFTSGYARDGAVRNIRLAEGAAFLPKPFTRATLLEKIREVLEG